MKISVIGLGFVGLSLASVLSTKGYSIQGIDVDKEKCMSIAQGKSPFFEPDLEKTLKKGLKNNLEISDNFSLIKNSDLIFVTVGTPQDKTGAIDLSMIKNAVRLIGKNISKSKKNPIILIKSTVTPGTMQEIILPILEKESKKKAGQDFGVISNPEFLQETTAIKDTKYPHVIVIGGYRTKFLEKTKKIFTKIHPNIPIIITNHQTAEIIKYANNSFLATKISFINQLSNICQKIPGADIDDIAQTIGLDPRIGKLFLNAGPGYGGSCLPKDMKALINFADKIGINPTLLDAVEKTNRHQLETVIQHISKSLGSLKNKRITVLGTAFKPNTDDVRDSIAIELIKKLLKVKSNITVYDPKAMKNTEKVFGNKIRYSKTTLEALKNSQCAVIMVNWKEFGKMDSSMVNKMSRKFIVDCRRVLVNKKLDIEYYAIGIGK